MEWFFFGAKVGKLLGRGWNGEVYALNEDRVVKFSRQPFDLELLTKLHSTKPNHFATIYRFGTNSNLCGALYRASDMMPYFVEMERLEELTNDEVKVFHSIVSHEHSNKVKQFSPEQLTEILDGLAKGLDFDRKRVEEFYWASMGGDIVHGDIHPKNLMRAKDGQFKFVDLDNLYLRNKEEPNDEGHTTNHC